MEMFETGHQRRFSRKRSRCCTPLVLYAAASVILQPVGGFVSTMVLTSPSTGTALRANVKSSSAVESAKPLTPKSASSKKRREEAIKAMKRTQVENALEGVDAQMLELLSDQFLYPESLGVTTKPSQRTENSYSKPNPNRPRGRPDFVPGAMKYETMLKYQEQKQDHDYDHDTQSARVETSPPQRNEQKEEASVESGKVKGSTKRRRFDSSFDADALPEMKTDTPGRRKRVVKNLPRRKDPSQAAEPKGKVLKGRAKANNLELQKYYRTELLNAEQEYSLGIQVQLMVKCEQVHEGLATKLFRLPTIQEWAAACG